ncbi:MAG TPA: DUF3052 domain-containing protein [Bacteroidia bacterium]|nr:DUF3052 domain-containing protein [Bacteroidia bacterium]
MAKTPGYSGTPLAKKLGIKENFRVQLIAQPEHYSALFDDLPEIRIVNDAKTPRDLVHFFVTKTAELEKKIPALKKTLAPAGMIWVSWPKKSSGVATDVTEDVIRSIALKNGLVDIKVCAIDETWSGLKLVIPVKDRKKLT